jgi:hypothetical protein
MSAVRTSLHRLIFCTGPMNSRAASGRRAMFDVIERSWSAAASRLDLWRYRIETHAKRLARAWCYFTGRLSVDDAQTVLLDCRYVAGWHPLLTLCVEDVLAEARETFADHPELPRLIADGCERVGDKWESHGDELYNARRWAIELAEGYAANEGITLVRLTEGADLPRVKDAAGIAEGGEP